MENKKIAVNINVRINLGDYQYIDKTVYAEKNIEYSTKEEMISKEDELTQEAVQNLIRNMRKIPDMLGKKTNAVQDVEDKMVKVVPEWLQNNEIPNMAKENHDAVTATQMDSIENKKVSAENNQKEIKELFGDN